MQINLKNYRNTLKQEIEPHEVDLLLCHVLKMDLAKLLTTQTINLKQKRIIDKFIGKLKKGVPLDIVLKHKSFFGYDFYCNKHVLTPRSETELLVDEVLKLLNNQPYSVLDLCCGSGCVGLSLKKQNNSLSVVLCDISQKALNVAHKNANKLKINVKIIKSNLFSKINNKFDIIVSNPPYIKTEEIGTLDKKVQKYDPHIALNGGDDGLKFYKLINENAFNYLNPKGKLCLEIGMGQLNDVMKIFTKNFVVKSVIKDYNQIDRIIILERI